MRTVGVAGIADHAKLRAALTECADFIFSIMRASTALWTPDADVHSSSVAQKLAANGNAAAAEQVLAAVADYDKGNMRMSLILASLEG